jgi:hypothetical protein
LTLVSCPKAKTQEAIGSLSDHISGIFSLSLSQRHRIFSSAPDLDNAKQEKMDLTLSEAEFPVLKGRPIVEDG